MTDLVKENFKSHFVKGILARWTLLLEIGELLNYILDIDSRHDRSMDRPGKFHSQRILQILFESLI